jgi:hypothetical protein
MNYCLFQLNFFRRFLQEQQIYVLSFQKGMALFLHFLDMEQQSNSVYAQQYTFMRLTSPTKKGAKQMEPQKLTYLSQVSNY